MKSLRELLGWRVLRDRNKELNGFIAIWDKFFDISYYRVVKFSFGLRQPEAFQVF